MYVYIAVIDIFLRYLLLIQKTAKLQDCFDQSLYPIMKEEYILTHPKCITIYFPSPELDIKFDNAKKY